MGEYYTSKNNRDVSVNKYLKSDMFVLIFVFKNHLQNLMQEVSNTYWLILVYL